MINLSPSSGHVLALESNVLGGDGIMMRKSSGVFLPQAFVGDTEWPYQLRGSKVQHHL